MIDFQTFSFQELLQLKIEHEVELKKREQEEKAAARYEEGLKAIGKGIEGKGVKERDALQRRLGSLQSRYANASKAYNVTFEYDGKGRALSMEYTRNREYAEEKNRMHGKYLLRTSLNEQNETDIWTFYNVIRTVEETFKTLKSDLDIRPVFHKGDKGTKAHLNLAVLAYWIVSTTKYRLKSKGIHVRWRELLRIMSTQVRVSAEFETDRNHQVIIRRSTEPEEKLLVIYNALGLKAGSMVKLKSVVHPKAPPKKLDG